MDAEQRRKQSNCWWNYEWQKLNEELIQKLKTVPPIVRLSNNWRIVY